MLLFLLKLTIILKVGLIPECKRSNRKDFLDKLERDILGLFHGYVNIGSRCEADRANRAKEFEEMVQTMLTERVFSRNQVRGNEFDELVLTDTGTAIDMVDYESDGSETQAERGPPSV